MFSMLLRTGLKDSVGRVGRPNREGNGVWNGVAPRRGFAVARAFAAAALAVWNHWMWPGRPCDTLCVGLRVEVAVPTVAAVPFANLHSSDDEAGLTIHD